MRRRGELTGLLLVRSARPYRTRWLAVAAAATLVIAGFFAHRLVSPPVTTMASTLQGLAGSRGSATVAATYRLTAERASRAPLPLAAAGGQQAIELRFDAAAEAGDRFDVEMLRVAGGNLQSVARVEAIPGADDGSVVVFVDAPALGPGDYLFRVIPSGGRATLEFAVHVGGR
jgi:hypothetical protein